MSSLTIKNELPTELIVLSEAIIERKDALIEHAHTALALPPIATTKQWQTEDQLAKDIGCLFKLVEEDRLAFGRKVKAITDRINEAAREALIPLKETWEKMVERGKVFEDAENARRAEEEHKAREEQRRKQAEEDARAETAAAEAKRRAEMEAEPGEAPAPVEFVPEVMPKQVERAYTPPPLKSSAAGKKGNKTLVVTNEALVPFMVNGIRLWNEVNKTACKALRMSGIDVPGTALEEPSGYSMKGGAR